MSEDITACMERVAREQLARLTGTQLRRGNVASVGAGPSTVVVDGQTMRLCDTGAEPPVGPGDPVVYLREGPTAVCLGRLKE